MNSKQLMSYKQLMNEMIGAWRGAWQTDFPFYYVQIAPYSGYAGNISGALLRETQTSCFSIPNTGMVVVSDLVDDLKNVHPADKFDVGKRLSNLALADHYGKTGLDYKFPMYKSRIEKEKIRILLENADNGLMSKGKEITEFYIAGEDRKLLPAQAKTEGNTIVVWNKSIQNPVAVRYCFTNTAIPNLFSKEGLPLNLFRTDHWE